MNRRWIVAVSLALALAFTAQGFAAAGRHREIDQQVKYRDLPESVQATVDKERGRHDIKSLWHVVRDGKEFYRAVIDTRGGDTVVRIRPNGVKLSEQETAEVIALPANANKNVRLARGESNGVEVPYERLPGPVREQIGALAGRDKVHEVIRYEVNGQRMYRVTVGEGLYARYIRVTEGGRTHSVRGDVDPGQPIPFDRCPGEVKRTIGAFAKTGKVDEVILYERGGKNYYQAEIEDKDKKQRFITVDSAGKEVKELPKH